MDALSLVVVGGDDRPVCQIRADSAVWEPARRVWRLVNGQEDDLSSPDGEVCTTDVADYGSETITPDEIQLYRNASYVDLLSTQHINELLKRRAAMARPTCCA